MKKYLISLVLLIPLFGTPAFADFQKGYSAILDGDYATAFKEWKPLADAGDVDAQFNLGRMYDNGHGVPQDYKEALKWYKLAADQGDASAQAALGYMYDIGQGVAQDYKSAIKWYKLAADQGYDSAQYNLGLMYTRGQGVPQDYTIAHMWFNIAASQEAEGAAKQRDKLEKKMTPADISKAQDMARECVAKLYKGC